MHVMFINTMEEYGFEKHERPNWKEKIDFLSCLNTVKWQTKAPQELGNWRLTHQKRTPPAIFEQQTP